MRKKKWIIIYAVISAIAFTAMLYLFWAQSIHYNRSYRSDLEAHITRALGNGGSGYSLEGKLVVWLNALTGSNTAFLVVLALLVTATPLAVGWLLTTMDELDTDFRVGGIRNAYIGMYSIFAAPMIIPFVWVWFYRNTMNINAWHNSTMMEMRLFSIIAFALFIRIQHIISGGRENRISPWLWLAFAASLLASTWFKPSFGIGFIPVMGFALLADILRNRKDRTRIRNNVIVGSAAIPAGVMILLQYWKLYGSREDISLVLSTEMNTAKYALRIGLFLVIPVIILLFNRKKIVRDYRAGNRAYVQVWALWALELLYHQLIAEVGRDGGNFGWGVRIGNFFVFVVSMRLFAGNCLMLKEKLQRKEPVPKREWFYIIGTGTVLLSEICCGIYFFIWLLQGKTYLI